MPVVNGAMILDNSFSKLKSLVQLQVWSKLLTFGLNVLVVRELSAEVYGAYAVELTLLLNVCLYLSRTALRNVTGRYGLKSGDALRTLSTSILVFPIGLLVCLLVYFLSAKTLSNAIEPVVVDVNDNDIKIDGTSSLSGGLAAILNSAPILMLIASFVELMSEPQHALLYNRHLVHVEARVQGLATLVRCVVVYFGVTRFHFGLLSFAYAQLAYALCMLIGMTFIVITNKIYLLIKDEIKAKNNNNNSSSNFVFVICSTLYEELTINGSLLFVFYWQSLQQLVLTESEKLALWFGATLFDQGTFSIVANLGSLVARMLFLPIEQATKFLFQKLNSQYQHERDTNKPDKNSSHLQLLQTMATVFALIVKLMTILSLLGVSLGPPNAYALLSLLYGDNIAQSDAPTILACYCVFILCMALNGVSEAFMHATANVESMKKFVFFFRKKCNYFCKF